MAIKTNYNFKGIEVKDAYIRIDRIFGSKAEGWNSLVRVYNITTKEIPAVVEEKDEDGNVVVEVKEATTNTVYNQIDEFNHQAAYVADERGYKTLYKSLTEKLGGIEV